MSLPSSVQSRRPGRHSRGTLADADGGIRFGSFRRHDPCAEWRCTLPGSAGPRSAHPVPGFLPSIAPAVGALGARIPLSLSGGGERRLALSDEGRTKISPTYCLRWVVLTSDIALRSPFVRQIRTFSRICRRIVACSPMKKTFSPFCFALFFRVFFSLPVGCYGCYGPRRAVCL